jgi:hypothetical protein
LQKYNVQRNFQLLSLDIDQNTFYILKKVLTSFSPDIIDVEYNSSHKPDEDKVVSYHDYAKWDKTNYFGGSLLSFYNMLRPLNYSLVYTEATGTDAFFVKDEIISKKNLHFENVNNVAKIYNSPKYGLGPDGGHPPDHFDRSYFTANQACFFIGESLHASDAPLEKVRVTVQGKEIILDPDNMKYNENNLPEYMSKEYGWVDYLGKQLEYAQKELLIAEVDSEAIYSLRFIESKDAGNSDNYAKAYSTANVDVVAAKRHVIDRKEVVGHIKAHLKAWDKNHENVQNRGHSLRQEMKVLNRDVYETDSTKNSCTFEDYLK